MSFKKKKRHHHAPSGKPAGKGPSLYGFHAVRAAWLNPERVVNALYLTNQSKSGFNEALLEAGNKGVKRPEPVIIDKKKLDTFLPKGAVHQGIALNANPLDEILAQDLIIQTRDKNNVVFLILDQVTDPHNVGAIIRSAAAFEADGMVMQRKHAPDLNNGVLAKSACGAIEHVPVAFETNLSRAIEEFKENGFFVYGLDELGSKTVRDITIPSAPEKIVLVLGSEGYGIRRLVKENCDELVRLPTSGPISSLNVSNAAAVVLYALK